MLKPPDGRADARFIPGVARGSTGGRGRAAVLAVGGGLVAGGRGRPLRGRLVEIRVELALVVAVAVPVAGVRLLPRVGRGGRGGGRRRRRVELRAAALLVVLARAPAAAARVLAEEWRGVERLLRLREAAAELALDLGHLVVPVLGRERAAGHGAAVVLGPH